MPTLFSGGEQHPTVLSMPMGKWDETNLAFHLASTAKRADVINTSSSCLRNILSLTLKTLGKTPSASDSSGVPIAAVQSPLLAFVPKRLRIKV